tara:strand:+ start:31646 stop:31774 length:129 start_codon:yes stop_codon:yes gene_type:complete
MLDEQNLQDLSYATGALLGLHQSAVTKDFYLTKAIKALTNFL